MENLELLKIANEEIKTLKGEIEQLQKKMTLSKRH